MKSERVLGTRKPGYAYLVPGSPEFPDGFGRRDEEGSSEMDRERREKGRVEMKGKKGVAKSML